MKNLVLACLAVAMIFGATSTLNAADEGLPTEAQMTEMGLSGIQLMTDDAGLDIRGDGFNLPRHVRIILYKIFRHIHHHHKPRPGYGGRPR